MFCPECKCEYLDGIIECADCHVKLVYELPVEPEEEYREVEPNVFGPREKDKEMVYVGMYRVPGHAEMLKDFLVENGVEASAIEYRFDQRTRLYVPREDARKAGELIKRFEGNAVQDSMEETPNEMEMENEEPEKSGCWQFFSKIRQFYVKISWLIFGIVWVFGGIYLNTYEKKYVHGIVITAMGAIIILLVLRQFFRSNERDER